MIRRLGDGRNSSFWEGAWAGDTTLREKIPRLFHLYLHQDRMVAEMGNWTNRYWCWQVDWRRPLLERELAIVETFYSFLGAFSPIENSTDYWSWGSDRNQAYSVREAY